METIATSLVGFEIRTLRNTVMPFKNEVIAGHYSFDLYGLFDTKTSSWVSLGSKCKYSGIAIPTQYKKSVWESIFPDGIIMDAKLGFELIHISKTLPYGKAA